MQILRYILIHLHTNVNFNECFNWSLTIHFYEIDSNFYCQKDIRILNSKLTKINL